MVLESKRIKTQTRKGQYLVLEQVIIFVMGLVIVSAFLATFTHFGDVSRNRIGDDQAEIMINMLVYYMIQLKHTNAQGEMIIDLPEDIAKKGYVIRFLEADNSVYIVTKSGRSARMKPFWVGDVKISGVVESTSKRIRLTYNNDKITISEV